MRNTYQSRTRKSRKFEVIGGRERAVRFPLPLVEVWEELPSRVEQLAGEARLKILHGILEAEVMQRVGPPHRPDPASGAVRWGRQPGYVVFGGQKMSLTRPRVRTREGEEGSRTAELRETATGRADAAGGSRAHHLRAFDADVSAGAAVGTGRLRHPQE